MSFRARNTLRPLSGPARSIIYALLFLVTGAHTGCTNTEQSEISITVGDETAYALYVEPYVTLRCGSLDCHGDMGRALRLYGGAGLRLQPELRGDFTSAEENRANVLAFAGISPEVGAGADPTQHLALLKGLAVSAGGLAHVGGDVWASTDEPGYRCILAWLRGQTDDPAAQADCALAAEEVPH